VVKEVFTTGEKEMAGYSKRSLLEKLGVKAGFKIAVVNAPTTYFKTLGKLPEGVQILRKPAKNMDFIHFFTKSREEYEKKFAELKRALVSNGMLWVSWPKGASKMPTDMTDNVVRDYAIKNGMVDIKVCAVDETWSGLKLVIPIKDRKV
jgi:hypothetical protein